MASGFAAPRNASIYYAYPRPLTIPCFFKNSESATCGFNIELYDTVRDMRQNVGDGHDSRRTGPRHPSAGQK